MCRDAKKVQRWCRCRCRCSGAVVQWCRGGAEVQRCRGAEVQRCRGTKVQQAQRCCRGAEVQIIWGVEVQMQRYRCRGAGCRCRGSEQVQPCRSEDMKMLRCRDAKVQRY